MTLCVNLQVGQLLALEAQLASATPADTLLLNAQIAALQSSIAGNIGLTVPPL